MTDTSRLENHLPPQDVPSLDVLVVPGAVVRRYDADPTVTDAIRARDVDAVLPVPPHANVAAQRLLHAVDRPVLRADRGMRASTASTAGGELVVAAVPSLDTLPDTVADIGPADSALPDRVVLVSNEFEMRVVPRRQDTVLDGIDGYFQRLPDAWHPAIAGSQPASPVTHASTNVQAGHTRSYRLTGDDTATRGTWAETGPPDTEVAVLGLGSASGMGAAAADTSTQQLVHATLYATGHATTTTLDPDDFGLRAVEQVGQARAQALTSNGVTDAAQLREMSVDALAKTLDTGQKTARKITTSAEALATGCVVRTGGDTLPDPDPVFIDIETDGLGASVAWLVGVLDGGSDSDSYYPFRQQIPSDPAAHLDAFATWLQGVPRSRPLVAWNGYSFDFDILTEQFREHCPDRLDEWESRRTLDLLYWARNRNNAVLPGRSNRLEAVAEAVGWEPATSGVDGATAARAYTRWRAAAASGAPDEAIWEPDWDRLETYCEDDVRALATIYEAIEDTPIRPAGGSADTDDGRQGSLSDFS